MRRRPGVFFAPPDSPGIRLLTSGPLFRVKHLRILALRLTTPTLHPNVPSSPISIDPSNEEPEVPTVADRRDDPGGRLRIVASHSHRAREAQWRFRLRHRSARPTEARSRPPGWHVPRPRNR